MGGVKGVMKVSCRLQFAHIREFATIRLFVTTLQNQTNSCKIDQITLWPILRSQRTNHVYNYKTDFDA